MSLPIIEKLKNRISALEKDYVVETGTATAEDDTVWKYTKWSSGKLEMTGTIVITNQERNEMYFPALFKDDNSIDYINGTPIGLRTWGLNIFHFQTVYNGNGVILISRNSTEVTEDFNMKMFILGTWK